MRPPTRIRLLAAVLAAAVAGCQDPYAGDPGRSAKPTATTTAALLRSSPAPSTVPPERVARAFAERWANWDGEHAARQQRALARLATGALSEQLRANAASTRIDATLARDKPGSRGNVVTVALRAASAQADGIVVTHEQTMTSGRADLGGLRYRVYVIRLKHERHGWGVSAWEPQP